MHTKNLTLIVALATVTTLSTLTLNAAEATPSPCATACQRKTVQATTADPNLLARNSAIAASPKTLANFPQLAKVHASQPTQPMVTCSCCKP